MINYQNGKIYKLTSSQTDKIYVGSTCDELKRRFSSHKSNFKTKTQVCKADEVLCFEDVKIELVENFPCDSKEKLHLRELHFIKELNAINVWLPVRDLEKKKATDKRWYQNHKEEQQQRSKEYRELNPEKAKASQKNWRESHAERVAEIQAAYWAANKAELQAKHKARDVTVTCPHCEKELKKYGLSRHINNLHNK